MSFILKTLKRLLNARGQSPVDERDHLVPSDRPDVALDYSQWCKVPEEQLGESCTSNSLEGYIQVPINIIRGAREPRRMTDLDATAHYKQVCAKYYDGDQSKGAYLRDCMKVAKKWGISEIYPDRGKVHTIKRYWKNRDIQDVESSYLQFGPVPVVIKIHSSFFHCQGVLIKPLDHDPFVGYHAVTVVMMDGETVKCRNSHGTDFGDHGYFTMTYEVFEHLFVESFGCEYNANIHDRLKLAENWLT